MSFQWYFLNDLRYEPDGDKGWIAYAPEDSAVIEEAYQAGKSTASLKNWTVHVKKLYQYRNDDHQRQRPVKRGPPGLDDTTAATTTKSAVKSTPAMTKELKTVQEYQVAIRVLEDTHIKRLEELNTEHTEKMRLVERALETAEKKVVTDLEKAERQHQIEKAKWKAEITERERQNAAQKEHFETESKKLQAEYQKREEETKKKHQELTEEQKKKNQDALSKLYEQARADADIAKKKHQDAMDEANARAERLKADLTTTRDHLQHVVARLRALEAKQKVVTASLSEAQNMLNAEDAATQIPLSLSQELDLHPPATIHTLAVPKPLSKQVAAPQLQEESPDKAKFALRSGDVPLGGGSPTQDYHEESDEDVDLRNPRVTDEQATQAYSPDSPKFDAQKRKRDDEGYNSEDLGDTDVEEVEGGGAQQASLQPSLATQKVASMDSQSPFLGSQGRKR